MACKPCQEIKAKLGTVSNIINGWTNLAFPSKEVEELANRRLEKCIPCVNMKPFYKVNDTQYYKCGLCNCPIDALVRSVDAKCEAKKW